MTKIDLENKINSFIEVNQGLKGTELVLKIMTLDLNVTNNEIMDAIFDLIERGEITEIECILPNRSSRSFLVPKGTHINIVNRAKVR